MNNYFTKLNDVNVNGHTEKKGKLTYLSWAWAWSELKKKYPDSFYTIYENADGWCYHTDGRTAWVKTGVTVADKLADLELEHIEYLPVMDYQNKSIPLERITSFDVNTAIQRSLTKAVARHGLGLYIYAGEDLPEIEADLPEEETERFKKSMAALENVSKEKKQKQAQEVPAVCECCKQEITAVGNWSVKDIADRSREKYNGRLFCYKCVTTHRAEEYISKESEVKG